jgi:hypothetical protein
MNNIEPLEPLAIASSLDCQLVAKAGLNQLLLLPPRVANTRLEQDLYGEPNLLSELAVIVAAKELVRLTSRFGHRRTEVMLRESRQQLDSVEKVRFPRGVGAGDHGQRTEREGEVLEGLEAVDLDPREHTLTVPTRAEDSG